MDRVTMCTVVPDYSPSLVDFMDSVEEDEVEEDPTGGIWTIVKKGVYTAKAKSITGSKNTKESIKIMNAKMKILERKKAFGVEFLDLMLSLEDQQDGDNECSAAALDSCIDQAMEDIHRLQEKATRWAGQIVKNNEKLQRKLSTSRKNRNRKSSSSKSVSSNRSFAVVATEPQEQETTEEEEEEVADINSESDDDTEGPAEKDLEEAGNNINKEVTILDDTSVTESETSDITSSTDGFRTGSNGQGGGTVTATTGTSGSGSEGEQSVEVSLKEWEEKKSGPEGVGGNLNLFRTRRQLERDPSLAVAPSFDEASDCKTSSCSMTSPINSKEGEEEEKEVAVEEEEEYGSPLFTVGDTDDDTDDDQVVELEEDPEVNGQDEQQEAQETDSREKDIAQEIDTDDDQVVVVNEEVEEELVEEDPEVNEQDEQQEAQETDSREKDDMGRNLSSQIAQEIDQILESDQDQIASSSTMEIDSDDDGDDDHDARSQASSVVTSSTSSGDSFNLALEELRQLVQKREERAQKESEDNLADVCHLRCITESKSSSGAGDLDLDNTATTTEEATETMCSDDEDLDDATLKEETAAETKCSDDDLDASTPKEEPVTETKCIDDDLNATAKEEPVTEADTADVVVQQGNTASQSTDRQAGPDSCRSLDESLVYSQSESVLVDTNIEDLVENFHTFLGLDNRQEEEEEEEQQQAQFSRNKRVEDISDDITVLSSNAYHQNVDNDDLKNDSPEYVSPMQDID